MMISGTIFWVLIINGWRPIDAQNIKIKGSNNLKKTVVISESELSLPFTLFSLDPNKLEESILRKLPVRSAIVRRHIIPPSLEIHLQEREPIAYATRLKGDLTEKGLVDKEGEWIPIKFLTSLPKPTSSLSVEGWSTQHKESISILLKNRNHLGSPLQRIILSPKGELNLETKDLGMIELGLSRGRLLGKLKAIAHLSKELPSNIRNKPGMSIDMTDPSKPELQFSEPKRQLN